MDGNIRGNHVQLLEGSGNSIRPARILALGYTDPSLIYSLSAGIRIVK